MVSVSSLLTKIKTEKGNDVCCECGISRPAWASSTIGVTLCINCAAKHRHMGPLKSRVKSFTLDEWTEAETRKLLEIGNIKSNEYFEKNLVRSTGFVITQEFIDDKYINLKWIGNEVTSSSIHQSNEGSTQAAPNTQTMNIESLL